MEQRYIKFIDKTETCWNWKGYIRRDGYANFKINPTTSQLAHRIAYELWVGEIPNDLLVRHKCDNRKCVNPEHLELGTQTDNMRDMVARGRRPHTIGTQNPNSKLTEDDVKEIRVLLDFGFLQKEIAEMYGVSQTRISVIKLNKHWSQTSALS